MPRVFAPDVCGPISVDTEILSLATGRPGAIAITGPAGSGKSTCLRHIAALFEHDERVVCVEGVRNVEIEPLAQRQLVIYTAIKPRRVSHLAELRLAPWSSDQILEYLTKRYPQDAAQLMQALLRWPALDDIGGNPAVLRVIIDAVAQRRAISARQALIQYFQEKSNAEQFELIAALGLFHTCGVVRNKSLHLSDENDFGVVAFELVRLFEHPYVRRVLGGAFVQQRLEVHAPKDTLEHHFPPELLADIAAEIKDQQKTLEYLRALLDGGKLQYHATAASLLHAVSPWKPEHPHQAVALPCAYLPHAAWRGVVLPALNIRSAELFQADLSRSRLTEVQANHALLERADLSHAHFVHWNASGANLSHADFSYFRSEHAILRQAVLIDTDFGCAMLPSADFSGADLRGAILVKARMNKANFVRAQLSGANLTNASLVRADFSGTVLRDTKLDGALLRFANMHKADLECVALTGADFTGANLTGALLTGSIFRDVKMKQCKLLNAGLADVDWEGVDLRRADFSDASFHLGSSRSGRVYSPIACEGSRTGFYTDEFHEQNFKAPEAIRKANLRGADLRGAKVEKADFYLVDLRDARYDDAQKEHFKRCGAILEHRV